MTMLKSTICLIAVLGSFYVTAAEEENTPFAALQWNLGDKSLKPDVVVGYRSVDVETDGDVDGWQGSISYKPGAGFDKVKVEAVTGDEDVQASYGAGYSLQQKQAMLSAGVNGSHLTAGADYLLGKHTLHPYLGITSLKEYDVPDQASTQSGGVKVESTDTFAVSGETLQETYFPEYSDCECE